MEVPEVLERERRLAVVGERPLLHGRPELRHHPHELVPGRRHGAECGWCRRHKSTPLTNEPVRCQGRPVPRRATRRGWPHRLAGGRGGAGGRAAARPRGEPHGLGAAARRPGGVLAGRGLGSARLRRLGPAGRTARLRRAGRCRGPAARHRRHRDRPPGRAVVRRHDRPAHRSAAPGPGAQPGAAGHQSRLRSGRDLGRAPGGPAGSRRSMPAAPRPTSLPEVIDAIAGPGPHGARPRRAGGGHGPDPYGGAAPGHRLPAHPRHPRPTGRGHGADPRRHG